MFALTPYRNIEGDDFDATVVHSVHVKLSRKERRNWRLNTRKGRRDLIDELTNRGKLVEPGCYCTHCQNDWDCCGNLILSYNKLVHIGNDVRIDQYLERNV